MGAFRPPYNPPRKKQKKEKQKLGFPIKDFGNDGGGGFPEWFYEGSK